MGKKEVKIAPSLLSCDFLNLEQEIKKLTASGADLLHLDVMDNHFVPNITFGFPIIKAIKDFSEIPIDVHLMVEKPENYLDKLSDIGADYISVHKEGNHHLQRLIGKIKKAGKKAGVVLNPATPISSIEPIIPDVDFILLMSVNPGFGGQKFLPLVYDKLDKLAKYKKKYTFEIEVDGGVDDKNHKKLKEKGVDIFVAGSYIFASDDYKIKIDSLRI